jgi:hypothetical protein
MSLVGAIEGAVTVASVALAARALKFVGLGQRVLSRRDHACRPRFHRDRPRLDRPAGSRAARSRARSTASCPAPLGAGRGAGAKPAPMYTRDDSVPGVRYENSPRTGPMSNPGAIPGVAIWSKRVHGRPRASAMPLDHATAAAAASRIRRPAPSA